MVESCAQAASLRSTIVRARRRAVSRSVTVVNATRGFMSRNRRHDDGFGLASRSATRRWTRSMSLPRWNCMMGQGAPVAHPSAEARVGLRVAAAEEQAQQRRRAVVLPDARLDDELPLADAQHGAAR